MKTTTLSLLASIITFAVVLSGAHAKDVVGMRNNMAKEDVVLKVNIKTADVAQKALSDLHNHVDKTSVKTMMKSAPIDSILSREREAKAEIIRIESSLAVRAMEALLLFRLAIARAFSY